MIPVRMLPLGEQIYTWHKWSPGTKPGGPDNEHWHLAVGTLRAVAELTVELVMVPLNESIRDQVLNRSGLEAEKLQALRDRPQNRVHPLVVISEEGLGTMVDGNHSAAVAMAEGKTEMLMLVVPWPYWKLCLADVPPALDAELLADTLEYNSKHRGGRPIE